MIFKYFVLCLSISILLLNCAKKEESDPSSASNDCSNVSSSSVDILCYNIDGGSSIKVVESSNSNKVIAGSLYKSISTTSMNQIYKVMSDSTETRPYVYVDFITGSTGTFSYGDNSSNKIGYYPSDDTTKIYLTSSSCSSSSNNSVITEFGTESSGKIKGSFSGTLFGYSLSTHQTSCSDNKTITGSFNILHDSERVEAGANYNFSSYYDIFSYKVDSNNTLRYLDNGTSLKIDNGSTINGATSKLYYGSNLLHFLSDNRTVAPSYSSGRPSLYVRYPDTSTGLHSFSTTDTTKISYYPAGSSKIYVTSSSSNCDSSSVKVKIDKYASVNGRVRGTFGGQLCAYANFSVDSSDTVIVNGAFDLTRLADQ